MAPRPTITLAALAELTGSEIIGDGEAQIAGVEDLEAASPHEAAFLENPRYSTLLATTRAGVIFIHPTIPREAGKNYLVNSQPSLAFQKAIEFFIPKITSGFIGIHPSAILHESVQIAEHTTIGPGAVIDQGVTIGRECEIGAGVSIGAGVTIGDHTRIHPNVVIREGIIIGNRVVIQPGAVIGSDGFGYYTNEKGEHHPLKQLGSVVLEDDVEIGANTTIDRARFKQTRIGRGTKIDNLVQIAHQVTIGPYSIIVAQVGIAGSTQIGSRVVIGGQVGIVGHLTIADRVMLAARSAVSKSIKKAGVYSGAPAIEIREFNEQIVYIRQLKKVFARLKVLEEKINSSYQTESQRPPSLKE